jgi:hypothetical protein
MKTLKATLARLWLPTLVMALTLTGCASAPPVDTRDETRSLVFGYFDMADAPSKVEWVSLRRYDAQKPGEWYALEVKDGLFFHVGIAPGSYQVEKFGGKGGIPLLTTRQFEYNFGSKGRNATAVRIREPGLYFLGAHQYVNHAGKGMFAPDKFEMVAVKTPTEKELLARLVKVMESDKELSAYARQLGLAKRRLARL